MYRMIDKFFLCGVGLALVFIMFDFIVRVEGAPDDVKQDRQAPFDHDKIERLLNGSSSYDEKRAILVFYQAGDKPEQEVKLQEEKDAGKIEKVVKLVSIAKFGDNFYAYGLVSSGDKQDTKRLKKGDVIGDEVVTGMSVDSVTLTSDHSSRILYIFSTKDQVSSKG